MSKPSAWGIAASVFFGIVVQLAPTPDNWRLPLTMIAGVGLLTSCAGWAVSYFRGSILKIVLERRWGSPVIANVINRDLDHPAHVKRSTLYGIVRGRFRERLYEAGKFKTCPPAPFTIDPGRQVQQAYGGYISFETFKYLQAELELENGQRFRSGKIKAPTPTRQGRSYEMLQEEPAAIEQPAFEIAALATPDLQNITERGFDIQKKPAWCLDCEVTIHNLNPTQGVDDVRLRILSITPPMPASPQHHPRMQDTTLRRVSYEFADIPSGKALLGDQTGHVRLFNVTRHIQLSNGGKTVVHVTLYGEWPDNLEATFAPESEHLMTVEVTGSGVKKQEAKFRLLFSADSATPVFAIGNGKELLEISQNAAEAEFFACLRKIRSGVPQLKALQEVDPFKFFKTTADLVEFGNNIKVHTGGNPCEELPVPQDNWLSFLRFSVGHDLSTNEGMEAALKDTLELPHRVEGLKVPEIPIEALQEAADRGRVLELIFASVNEPLPEGQPRAWVNETTKVLRVRAYDYLKRFSEAVENPQTGVKYPRSEYTPGQVADWSSDPKRRNGWHVIVAGLQSLHEIKRELSKPSS